jgi:GPH family glycoside/pentoside/hexuronide:cation symporter
MSPSEPSARERHPSARERLPRSRIALYALPSVGVGYMLFLVSLWYLKFSTDLLLLPPESIAAMFAAARIWDAVIDPLAGWVSDRTRTPIGRRRPYMLVAALALPFTFYWLFNPPTTLDGSSLLAWSAVGLFLVYTGSTAFLVPHQALGAELSENPTERSWVFGANFASWQLGAAAAMATMAVVENALDAGNARQVLPEITLPLALLSGAFMAICATRLRERPEYQGRGSDSLLRAFGDVWRNPHARPLLIAFFIDSIGIAGVGIIAPYVADYLLGGAQVLLFFFGFYTVPAILLAPAWPALAARTGKKALWLGSLVVAGVGFGGFFFLDAGDTASLCLLAALIGSAGSCAQVIVPSLQADVVDWDEWKTGERKEGAYFAMRTFLLKSAFGVMVMIVGVTLRRVGYVPGAEQSDLAKLALRSLFSLLPLTFYLGTALYVWRFFRFTGEEHARVRAELDRRARERHA